MSHETKDSCLPCRIITSFVPMLAGAFVYSKSNGRGKIERKLMGTIALSLVGVGVLRLFDLSFLKSKESKGS